MRIGIVGSEAAKFTQAGESMARCIIATFCSPGDVIISGGCHLGGIDAWAVELGKQFRCQTVEHLPKVLSWEDGYKPRNILIAEDSDLVVCITVDKLPASYSGMTFATCYHCHTSNHVKSGGCWTTKYARKIGKLTDTFVVRNL